MNNAKYYINNANNNIYKKKNNKNQKSKKQLNRMKNIRKKEKNISKPMLNKNIKKMYIYLDKGMNIEIFTMQDNHNKPRVEFNHIDVKIVTD